MGVSIWEGGKAQELIDAVKQIKISIPDNIKSSLLNCFQHVAWTNDNGEAYYAALQTALYSDSSTYPKVTAVFNQGSDDIYVYDNLDILKQYLTVTYFESAQSAGTVIEDSSYTLSGELVAGTSYITVSYMHATTAFEVIVSGSDIKYELSYPEYNGLQVYDQLQGDNSQATATYMYFVAKTNSARSLLALNSGENSICNEQGEYVDKYMIKIPSDATSITIEMNPTTVYAFLSGLTWHTDGIPHFYRRWDSAAWVTNGTTCDISSFQRSDQRYLCVNLKEDNSRTPPNVSKIKITFNTN